MSRIESSNTPAGPLPTPVDTKSEADWQAALGADGKSSAGDASKDASPTGSDKQAAQSGKEQPKPAAEQAGGGRIQILENPPPVGLAMVGGAGLIGRQHIERIEKLPEAQVHSIIGASSASRAYADAKDFQWFRTIESMIGATKTAAVERPGGAIVCSPNDKHVENGLYLIKNSIPLLIEKPLADTVAGAKKLVAAAEKAGVPLATGHHRRHNDLVREAKKIIDSGALGQITIAHGSFCLMKPDKYFVGALDWHAKPGAGAILLNLVHDIDLMRHFLGDVESVYATSSNAVRGHPVDETTAAILKFKNGAMGTFNVSDTSISPRSWEHTTGENLVYPKTSENCYTVSGTKGTLDFPSLKLWTQAHPDWHNPFETHSIIGPRSDALANQISQFCKVIRGEEQPLVSGREGMETLKVIDAIIKSAGNGRRVDLS